MGEGWCLFGFYLVGAFYRYVFVNAGEFFNKMEVE